MISRDCRLVNLLVGLFVFTFQARICLINIIEVKLCMMVNWIVDAAVSVHGNIFAESSNFDEVLLDFADHLSDTSIGELDFALF